MNFVDMLKDNRETFYIDDLTNEAYSIDGIKDILKDAFYDGNHKLSAWYNKKVKTRNSSDFIDSDTLFDEYLDATSNNKIIELYNKVRFSMHRKSTPGLREGTEASDIAQGGTKFGKLYRADPKKKEELRKIKDEEEEEEMKNAKDKDSKDKDSEDSEDSKDSKDKKKKPKGNFFKNKFKGK